MVIINMKCVMKFAVLVIGIVSMFTALAVTTNLSYSESVANGSVKQAVIAEPQIASIGKDTSNTSQNGTVYVLKQRSKSIYGASLHQGHFLRGLVVFQFK